VVKSSVEFMGVYGVQRCMSIENHSDILQSYSTGKKMANM